MSFEDVEFWRRRERQERAAAKQAADFGVRRAHQELAVQYSLLILDAAVQRELAMESTRTR
jgi:hypothetical protein